MNPQAQKTHRTVTQQLAADITVFAEAMLQRFAEVNTYATTTTEMLLQQGETLRAAIGDERTARLRLADEQRHYVDKHDRALAERIERFERLTGHGWRGVWCRVKWMWSGR